ncbi:MAG: hypothetical protein AB1486_21615 [Planctomycetota bacterium]
MVLQAVADEVETRSPPGLFAFLDDPDQERDSREPFFSRLHEERL